MVYIHFAFNSTSLISVKLFEEHFVRPLVLTAYLKTKPFDRPSFF